MDENSLVNVIIRDFIPNLDSPYIYSSWRNQAYYSSVCTPGGDPAKFFREKSYQIKDVLAKATVRVACTEGSPNVIIGYSVSTGTHLDWVYVKSVCRNAGIGRMLVPKNIKTVTSELTKIGLEIVNKKNLTVKGETTNGRSNTDRSPEADQASQA